MLTNFVLVWSPRQIPKVSLCIVSLDSQTPKDRTGQLFILNGPVGRRILLLTLSNLRHVGTYYQSNRPIVSKFMQILLALAVYVVNLW